MLLTFWIGVGVPARPDDKRWLVVPVIDIWMQPVELLKISFVIIFALHIAKLGDSINRPPHLLGLLAHAAIPILLVHFQGDGGSALMILLIAAVMLFCGGLAWRYIVAGIVGAVAAVPIVWSYVLADFQKTRLRTLFDQSGADPLGNYYQQYRAMIAIANGGATGVGLLGDHIYVPEMHTDFAFAFFCQCFGFMGALGLLTLMILLCFKVLYNARSAKDSFGALICEGVFALLLLPCCINVAMCISLMPVIGNPFPFLSYGGSSVVSNYVAVGLVLSVYGSKQREMFS
jgi:rod shape determining protein RodA